MSRPQSTIVAPSTSYRQPPAEILLANLRLLDLDLREDWPEITARTFTTKESQQSQKQRIRCTEWILYRLFEVWDPGETRDKLQPFFPPLEPLQSLNLRGALFRALNELKKNGLLGRETILRKTMLDECKGEKLVELLVVFSTVVLRKSHARNKSIPSVSYKLATTPVLHAAQQGSLIPLTIAHCASLSSMLKTRQIKKERLAHFDALLDSKRGQLRERVKASVQSRRRESSAAEEAQIKRIVQDNWTGDDGWSRAMLTGDETKTSDLPLQQPFNQVWKAVLEGRQIHSETANLGLLATLDRRVRMQSEQLQIWQEFHQKLKESNAEALTTDVRQSGSSVKAAFTFDRHQALQFIPGRVANSHGKPISKKTTSFEHIVLGLQHDLAAVSSPRRLGGKGWSSLRHNTSETIANHDLFSPVKSGIPSHENHAVGNVALPIRQNIFQDLPPLLAPATMQKPIPSKSDGKANMNKFSEVTLSNSSSLVPAAVTNESSLPEMYHEASPDNLTPTTARSDSSELEEDTVTDEFTSPVAKAVPVSLKQPLSLMERTRLSMASLKTMPADEAASTDSDSTVPEREPESNLMGEEKINRRMSLLDRTRLSMAQVSSQPLKSKHPTRKEMRQSLFPINQFETPGRNRAAPSPRRNATPTEKLFSEEAEYASVFRSRPKIAVSPIVSPEGLECDQSDGSVELEDDEGDISADWESSPLGKKDLGIRA